ncbi:MAG: SDR family oxidoreductase [Myxococcota bacterium]
MPLALEGKELFITGTTGFLGKVLVAHLLHEVPNVGRLHLLVRFSKSRAGVVSAVERFRRIALRSPAFRPLRARHGKDLEAFLATKVSVWEGDVTDTDCGLSPVAIERLAPVVDAVIHVAGLTDFEPDPRKALEVNVRGAVRVLDLASRFERAIMIHTSTCYVAGKTSGRVAESLRPLGASSVAPQKVFDPEVELAHFAALAKGPAGVDPKDPDAKLDRINAATARSNAVGFPNTYTYSKALAEHLLVAKAPTNGTRRPVQLTIVRPAVIECAEHFPFKGWNEGVNTTGPLMWLIKSYFRHLPCRPANRFDIVPVDACTRGLMTITAAALSGRSKAGAIYQLATSGSNPLTMGRAMELNNLAVRKDLGASNRPMHARWAQRFFDAVPVGADDQHFFAPTRLRRLAKDVKTLIGGVSEKKLAPAVRRGKETAEMVLDDVDKTLGRVQRMLDLYRPFIHDHDWIFENSGVRTLDAQLDADSKARFGWIGDAIDWRRYWLDVLYPGLNTWCLPILDGKEVPEDPLPAWAADKAHAVEAAPDAAPERPESTLGDATPSPL